MTTARKIDDDALGDMAPAEALSKAVRGSIDLTVGQFLWTRRESLNRTPAGMAALLEVAEATYLTWENDKTPIPEAYRAKLKSALACRGGQYDELFDKVIGTGAVASVKPAAVALPLPVEPPARSVPLRVTPSPSLVREIPEPRQIPAPASVKVSAPPIVRAPVMAPVVERVRKRKIDVPGTGMIEVALDDTRHTLQSDAGIVLGMALDGEIILQPHVFLNYRHQVQPNVSLKAISEATGLEVPHIYEIFDGTKPIPAQSISAFKRVLKCEGPKYSAYFDALFAPLSEVKAVDVGAVAPVADQGVGASAKPATQIAKEGATTPVKMVAPRNLDAIDYVEITEAMSDALWDGKKDIWNAGIKQLLADNPHSMIDLRDQDFQGANKHYGGFDFSNCDLRGAAFPLGDRFRNVTLKSALLVDGAHTATNTAYNDLPANVKKAYESREHGVG